jgi:hypothetical protein
VSELGDCIYKRARLTGEFRLRSGATSNEYFDKYLFESDPRLLREIAEELVSLLPAGVELLAGLELGGVPLAVVVSQVSGLPSVFVRKAAKTYGTCRLAKDGKVRRLRQLLLIVGAAKTGERACWLEPWGGDADWRAEMWGQIVALHGRYPRTLAYLKDEWWTEEQHTETLCALAVWRSELDDAGVDPREELAFHAQLADYAQTLRQEGGGVTKAWKPGAPPDEWTRG